MAIQKINLGTEPLGEGGDTYRSANTKINENFANTAHAASRLVGTATGNVMEVGAFGLGGQLQDNVTSAEHFNNKAVTQRGSLRGYYDAARVVMPYTINTSLMLVYSGDWATQVVFAPDSKNSAPKYRNFISGNTWSGWTDFWTATNATKDGNGFLKAASPVVDLYDDRIELNQDAKLQSGITFEKLGIGDYLVNGSLGFAQEGWYIETPKDANGNILVAVTYEQLENNDISIKTYDYMLNKKGRIVPDTETPLDIPEGRCINLRLHEIKEQLEDGPSETESK